MEPVSVDELVDRLEEGNAEVHEFLRRDSMSLELYRLEAGATDQQSPHDEDEVYYVVSGVAKSGSARKRTTWRRGTSSSSNVGSATGSSTSRRTWSP